MRFKKIPRAFFQAIPKRMRRKLKSTVFTSPMQLVLQELKRRNVQLKKLKALEVFGRDGEWHTIDYAPHVASLEIWEIDREFEEGLRSNLPNADVRIVDSYKEIVSVGAKYSLIVVDNPLSIHGENYCEHFQLFPDIPRIAMDSAIVILNVIPEVSQSDLEEYPYLFNANQLEYRRQFYNTNHPKRMTLGEMTSAYKEKLLGSGYDLEWYFFIRRSFAHYLTLAIRKKDCGSTFAQQLSHQAKSK